jgi:hypothetical protein
MGHANRIDFRMGDTGISRRTRIMLQDVTAQQCICGDYEIRQTKFEGQSLGLPMDSESSWSIEVQSYHRWISLSATRPIIDFVVRQSFDAVCLIIQPRIRAPRFKSVVEQSCHRYQHCFMRKMTVRG